MKCTVDVKTMEEQLRPDGGLFQRTQLLLDEVRVDTVIFQVLEKPGITQKRELLLIFLDAATNTTGRQLCYHAETGAG